MDATYSPEDNKLRLYAETRLDRETYDRVKAAGFRWAPKQELFVAPMWTPDREDLLIELCGEIGDEDKSLVERTEERAERFEDYADNRATDADQARKAVSAIADNIPLGQPILVGHHSEKRARRDAAKIENGMRRAVKMWEQSQYWKDRAKGAIRHAKYKELPSVRARRIKTIEADKRKTERTKAHAEFVIKFWRGELKLKSGGTLAVDLKSALWFANSHDHFSRCYTLAEFPRTVHTYEGQMSLWSALGGNINGEEPASVAIVTPEQAGKLSIEAHSQTLERCNRWLAHYENRLAYERAMLEESGGTVTDKTGPEKGGACKCWASPRGGWSYVQKVNQISVTVLDNWSNGGNNFTRTISFDKLSALMSAAEVQAAREAGRVIDMPADARGTVQGFHLCADKETTDKVKEKLAELDKADEEKSKAMPAQTTAPTVYKSEPPGLPAKQWHFPAKPDNAADFKAMKETLAAGVQVVAANQLFPTPPELCERMADLADLTAGDRVLEPSAGTGNLLAAIKCRGIFADDLTAIEINPTLANGLKVRANAGSGFCHVRCADFLECVDQEGFDKILMNPPFENAADIKHIEHARTFLRPGGKLVAICANGPRQQDKLKPIADSWEVLPPGTFNGTNVNAALLVINAADTGKPILNALLDASERLDVTLPPDPRKGGPDMTDAEFFKMINQECRRVQRFHNGLPQTTNGQGELF